MPCRGFCSCPAGFVFCPAGDSFLPCRVFLLPYRGFFPALQGFFPALRRFLFCPARVPFPSCAVTLCRVLPVQGSSSTLCRVLFHPVQDSLFTLCRIPFPPCAGFLFHPVQDSFSTLCPVQDSFSTLCPVQGSFSTLRRHPVQGFFPALLGFLFCPGVSFLPCRGILSILRQVLVELQQSLLDPTRVSFLRCVFPFHPQGVFFSALQVFFALQGFLFLPCGVSFLPGWNKNPAQGGKGSLHRVEKEP